MKRKKIIIAALGVMLAAGIGFTGYKLLNKDDNISPDAVPVEQALGELKDYKFGEYDTIKFDCEVKMTEPSKVYESIDIVRVADNTKTNEQIQQQGAELLNLVTGLGVLPDDLKKGEERLYGNENGEKPYNVNLIKDNELIFDYFYNNSFLLTDLSAINDVDNATGTENTNVVKRLRPDEITDDLVYDLSGEKYALKDAVSFTDGVIEKLKDKYFNGHRPQLANIAIVYFPETNDYSYILRYYHIIDGLFLDDISIANPNYDYLYGCYLDVEIRSKDKIFYISNYAYQQISDKNELMEMIPLSDAEKMAAEILADKAEYTVTECELKYVCITNVDNSNSQYKPMWVFTLKEENSEKYNYSSNNFDKMNFYIDAATGDYYLYQYATDFVIKNGDDSFIKQNDISGELE